MRLPVPTWPLYRIEENESPFFEGDLVVGMRTAVGPYRKEYLVTYAIRNVQLTQDRHLGAMVDVVCTELHARLIRNIQEGERS